MRRQGSNLQSKCFIHPFASGSRVPPSAQLKAFREGGTKSSERHVRFGAGAAIPERSRPKLGINNRPHHSGDSVGNAVDAMLFDLGRVIIDLDTKRMLSRWAELAGVPVSRIDEQIAERVVGAA